MRPIYTIFLLAAASSYGATVTYTSFSTWQAAGPVDSGIITFDGISSGQVSSPLLILGFSFSGVNGNLLMYNPEQSFTSLGAGPSLSGPQSPGAISINVPTNTFGVGLLVGLWGSGSTQLTISVNGSQVYLNSNNDPINAGFAGSPSFLGFRSDTAITNLTIAAAGAGNRVNIDSVRWGAQGEPPPPPPNETPEAATAILIGSALLLLPTLRRRFVLSSYNSSSPTNSQFAH